MPLNDTQLVWWRWKYCLRFLSSSLVSHRHKTMHSSGIAGSYFRARGYWLVNYWLPISTATVHPPIIIEIRSLISRIFAQSVRLCTCFWLLRRWLQAQQKALNLNNRTDRFRSVVADLNGRSDQPDCVLERSAGECYAALQHSLRPTHYFDKQWASRCICIILGLPREQFATHVHYEMNILHPAGQRNPILTFHTATRKIASTTGCTKSERMLCSPIRIRFHAQ